MGGQFLVSLVVSMTRGHSWHFVGLRPGMLNVLQNEGGVLKNEKHFSIPGGKMDSIRENVARTGVSGRKLVMPEDRVPRLLIAAWAAKRGPSKWRSLVGDQELRHTLN